MNLASTDAALSASYALMISSSRRPAPSHIPPSLPSTRSPIILHSSSSPQKPERCRTPVTPTTPCRPSTPTIPCAPRKRSRPEHNRTFEPTAPQKHINMLPATSEITPSRPRYKRAKRLIPLDKAICVPMQVLRAQRDDASALLRPPLQRTDRLRKLVDLSIERTLETLRAPGGTGILEAAVWSPKKAKAGVQVENRSLSRKRRVSREESGGRSSCAEVWTPI